MHEGKWTITAATLLSRGGGPWPRVRHFTCNCAPSHSSPCDLPNAKLKFLKFSSFIFKFYYLLLFCVQIHNLAKFRVLLYIYKIENILIAVNKMGIELRILNYFKYLTLLSSLTMFNRVIGEFLVWKNSVVPATLRWVWPQTSIVSRGFV